MSSLSLRSAIPFLILTGLIGSGVALLTESHTVMDNILFATLILGSLPLFWGMIRTVLRGHFGIDLIAIVAIVASILLHEYLAGTVILLMLSGGEALEGYALRRARRELTSLIEGAPTIAHKAGPDGIVDVPVEEVQPGDLIIVKPGELVPVDGRIESGVSMVDESMLTGEALLIEKVRGASVMSGSVSKDGVLEVRALKPSTESKYQQIIRLVKEAEEHKAPFVRLADRYSVWFTGATFVLALLAWILSKDPVRVLAVLVVATPCPLILATPIAFASGISRAAKRGIIVKNGGALEQLGEARCFIFDKTGTLTLGLPAIDHVEGYTMTPEKVLHLAASIDQLSVHVFARSLLQRARDKGLTLAIPDPFEEKIGQGVKGSIGGQTYIFGRLAFIESHGIAVTQEIAEGHDREREQGRIGVYLADEKQVVGSVFFADTVRPDVRSLFAGLTRLGIQRVVMLTGDKRTVALRIAKEVGIAEENVRAECLPEDKVTIVKQIRSESAPVVMVGDGVNDAPAIMAADVGIAMGAHGSTASSEAGDVVILVDKIERVGEALCIGHRVLAIAKESIFIGIGLSLVLMVAATFGFIQPVYGALMQEVIDALVIFNSLRVLFTHCSLNGDVQSSS